MSTALATAMARLAGFELAPAVAIRLAAAGRAWDVAPASTPATAVPTQR